MNVNGRGSSSGVLRSLRGKVHRSIQSCNHPCYNLTRFYVGKNKGTVDLMNVFVTYGVTNEAMIGVKVEDMAMECDDFRKRYDSDQGQ